MDSFAIGVDTGGTYTDAVVINQTNGNVIATAKALTTHGDLARGVSNALKRVLEVAPHLPRRKICRVCLSTTLATNALVEGRGSSIAVVLIGFDSAMVERTNIASAIPDAEIVTLTGGHRYDGQEQLPLDTESLIEFLQSSAHRVDAFAIASHYAVRNPTHERIVEALINEHTGKPVSASCDLSDSLDGPKRALTAAFNARIISLIVWLQEAVEESLRALDIDAPVMIVKGDGSVAQARSVLNKPIETILSGPAASVIGARYLCGLSEFVLCDIGGTTTDVATVINGWPAINDHGASVGGFRTLVKAIDIRTLGLGGDSAVEITDNDQLLLRNYRVMPISMLAHRWPQVENQLQSALSATSGMRAALCYLVLSERKVKTNSLQLSGTDQKFLDKLPVSGPSLMSDVVTGASDRSSIKRLVNRGYLRLSGYTPSDAAHVLNLQSQWSRPAAVAATELLGRAHHRISGDHGDWQIETLSRQVVNLVIEKSTRLLIDQLGGQNFSATDVLIDASARHQLRVNHLDVSLKSALPIVAVGGPATVFYPQVGRRLSSETIIPKHSEVANAIGAAVGRIRATASVEITTKENGGYWIHGEPRPQSAEDGTQAIECATQLAQKLVHQDILNKGGKISKIHVRIDRVTIPDTDGDTGLVSAKVYAICESLPNLS